MAQTTRFWNGTVKGDAGAYSDRAFQEVIETLTYNANEAGSPLGHIVGSGGTLSAMPLGVSPNSPNDGTVIVNQGKGFYFGIYYENDSNLQLNIDFNATASPRTDYIVLQIDYDEQIGRIVVRPNSPTLVQDPYVFYEYKLAEVTVPALTGTITSAMIDNSFNVPLQYLDFTFKTTANTNAPSTFSALWDNTSIQAAPINAVQYTDDSALFLSVDDGANWFRVSPKRDTTLEITSVTSNATTWTTLTGVSISDTAIGDYLILTVQLRWHKTSGSLQSAYRIRENGTVIYTSPTPNGISSASSIEPSTFVRSFKRNTTEGTTYTYDIQIQQNVGGVETTTLSNSTIRLEV